MLWKKPAACGLVTLTPCRLHLPISQSGKCNPKNRSHLATTGVELSRGQRGRHNAACRRFRSEIRVRSADSGMRTRSSGRSPGRLSFMVWPCAGVYVSGQVITMKVLAYARQRTRPCHFQALRKTSASRLRLLRLAYRRLRVAMRSTIFLNQIPGLNSGPAYEPGLRVS
jgi:hypothetical protein